MVANHPNGENQRQRHHIHKFIYFPKDLLKIQGYKIKREEADSLSRAEVLPRSARRRPAQQAHAVTTNANAIARCRSIPLPLRAMPAGWRELCKAPPPPFTLTHKWVFFTISVLFLQGPEHGAAGEVEKGGAVEWKCKANR